MTLTQRSTSSRFASRWVDRLGGRPFAISNLALHDIADLPQTSGAGIPTAASLWSFRGLSVEASAIGVPESCAGSNSRATILRHPAEAHLCVQMKGKDG